MASPLPSHRPRPKGQQLAVGSVELPRDSSESSMDSPPPVEKRYTFGMLAPPSPDFEPGDLRTGASLSSESEDGSRPFLHELLIFTWPQLDFGMPATHSLSPEEKCDFGMRDTPSPSPEGKFHFGMRDTPSPSPEEKFHFGMRDTPSPLPERKYDFGTRVTPSPLQEGKFDFGMRATPSPEPKQKQDSGIRTPLFLPSPVSSPVSMHKSDFGLLGSLSPEPQDDLTTPPPFSPEPQGFGIHQPKGDKEPLGSSSKMRTWRWGEPAPPSPTNSKEKGQPSTVERKLESDDDNDPHSDASILRDQAGLLRNIHGYISGVYRSEGNSKLSEVMDAMIEDLEDAEVKAIM